MRSGTYGRFWRIQLNNPCLAAMRAVASIIVVLLIFYFCCVLTLPCDYSDDASIIAATVVIFI